MICLFHKREYKGIYYDTKDKSIILYSVTKCKKCGKMWKEEINKTEYLFFQLLSFSTYLNIIINFFVKTHNITSI